MNGHPREQLTAYADGELDRAAATEVEHHLAMCTECTRQLAVQRSLKGAIRDMQVTGQRDLWGNVHRRLTTPAAWLLITAGVAIWATLALVRWFQAELTIEWLAATALGTGVLLLLVAMIQEQYRQWKIERYKDVER